jgi:hypothetical protein
MVLLYLFLYPLLLRIIIIASSVVHDFSVVYLAFSLELGILPRLQIVKYMTLADFWKPASTSVTDNLTASDRLEYS